MFISGHQVAINVNIALQAGNGELLLTKYWLIITVGIWYYNKSDVTEL